MARRTAFEVVAAQGGAPDNLEDKEGADWRRPSHLAAYARCQGLQICVYVHKFNRHSCVNPSTLNADAPHVKDGALGLAAPGRITLTPSRADVTQACGDASHSCATRSTDPRPHVLGEAFCLAAAAAALGVRRSRPPRCRARSAGGPNHREVVRVESRLDALSTARTQPARALQMPAEHPTHRRRTLPRPRFVLGFAKVHIFRIIWAILLCDLLGGMPPAP